MKNHQMNNGSEDWIEEVFHSMKNSERAQPDSHLLLKINNQINSIGSEVIPMDQWRKVAAAAAVILLVNITAIIRYHNTEGLQSTDAVASEHYGSSLISTYQIYK